MNSSDSFNEVSMDLNLTYIAGEIVEFLSAETLRDIDLGVLDLSHILDADLRHVLCFLGEALANELKVNYMENRTGIFRVELNSNGFCYRECGYIIEADSLLELKELVLGENRIWYVFDEELLENLTCFTREVIS